MLRSTDRKLEDMFNLALASLTTEIHGPRSEPVSDAEGYQRLCVRELVRGMVAARLLAESMNNPMLQDELHELSSKMTDVLAHVYPAVGLAGSNADAAEDLSKLGTVSAWKIHTRIMNLLTPAKKERPSSIPFWPVSQFKAA